MEMSSLSDAPLSQAQLIDSVNDLLSVNPALSVLIRGDKNVEYGVVVELMAVVQAAGAQGVGLITEDP